MSDNINVDSELFCNRLCEWLQEKGFSNDRGWANDGSSDLSFYSFVKGPYRFEIKLNWDRKYNWYSPVVVNFIDCSKEWWGEPLDCLIWMGQNTLHTFNEPFSKKTFESICEHYKL
jgi:hypothetical protein